MSDKWHKSTPAGQLPDREPVWRTLALPFAILLALLGITAYATHYQFKEERAEAIDNGEIVRTLLARRLERLANDTMVPIRRLKAGWSEAAPDQQSFSKAVADVAELVQEAGDGENATPTASAN